MLTCLSVLFSKTLEQKAAPILPKLAQRVLVNFDVKTKAVWQPFMSGDTENKEIPGRSGYYVGYKVAEELGKEMSLRQLAKLRGDDLRKKMKEVLEKFVRNK
jgi:hypothetical protein